MAEQEFIAESPGPGFRPDRDQPDVYPARDDDHGAVAREGASQKCLRCPLSLYPKTYGFVFQGQRFIFRDR